MRGRLRRARARTCPSAPTSLRSGMHPPPRRDADRFPGLEEDLGASRAPRTPAMDGDDYITASGQGRASSEHSLLLDAGRGLASTAQSPLPGSPTSLQGGGSGAKAWDGAARAGLGSAGRGWLYRRLSGTARPAGVGSPQSWGRGAGDGVAQGRKLGKVPGRRGEAGGGQGRDSYPDRAPAFPAEGLEKLSRRLGLGCKARSPPARDTKLGARGGGGSATPEGGASGGRGARRPGPRGGGSRRRLPAVCPLLRRPPSASSSRLSPAARAALTPSARPGRELRMWGFRALEGCRGPDERPTTPGAREPPHQPLLRPTRTCPPPRSPSATLPLTPPHYRVLEVRGRGTPKRGLGSRLRILPARPAPGNHASLTSGPPAPTGAGGGQLPSEAGVPASPSSSQDQGRSDPKG